MEAGRLSLLLTLKLNYKPFMKHQWIHLFQVTWIRLADAGMEGGLGRNRVEVLTCTILVV